MLLDVPADFTSFALSVSTAVLVPVVASAIVSSNAMILAVVPSSCHYPPALKAPPPYLVVQAFGLAPVPPNPPALFSVVEDDVADDA